MLRRLLKQFLYGLFYFTILGAIGFGVYWGYFRPAPSCFDGVLNQNEEEIDCGGACEDCALGRLVPLRFDPVQLFHAGDFGTTIFLQFRNSNTTYGASSFNYELNLYNSSGVVIYSQKDKSFIYPGETKALILPAVEVDFIDILRSEVKISGVSWIKAEEFPRPEIAAKDIIFKIDGERAVISGVVSNNSPFLISKAIVGGIVVAKNGIYINASNTSVMDIAAFSEKQFQIFVPVLKTDIGNIDPALVRVSVEAIR